MSRHANTYYGAGLLLTSIVASSGAQLLLKAGMVSLHAQLTSVESFIDGFMHSSAIWWVLGGFACYGISLIAWLGVLARFALSLAYPLLGFSYVIVYVVAIAWPRLAEPLTVTRLLGILLVVAGGALVATSGQATRKKPAPKP